MALVGATLLGAALLAAGATAAAPSAPSGSALGGLVRAWSALGPLAGQTRSASARRRLSAAEGELAAAVVPALWIDASHVVAPAYGASVFAHSRAALAGLEQVPSSAVPAGAVAGVETSVLGADRSLALGGDPPGRRRGRRPGRQGQGA